ncbi:hypothetical protein [Cupriavidus necator]|uniref:hypothetical protein n=1 Tax=Cupriavidus necator TaxID=106590 RepID=UPI00339D4243
MTTTTLWIDCEFNEFRGELISMAIVDAHGAYWYKSLGCDNPGAWVAEHVMPIIGVAPVSRGEMQRSLQAFLGRYEEIHLVADWPEDIAHFCNILITGPGLRLNTPPLTMEVRRDLDSVSKIPHNALADALAIMERHLQIVGAPE